MNNTSYEISVNSELNQSFDRGCAGLVRMNLHANQAKMLTDIGGENIKVKGSSNEMRNKGKSCTNVVKSF